MKRTIVLVILMALVFSAPAFADKILENAQSSDYVTKMPAQLLRGVGNVVVSPVEVLSHGYKGTVEGRPIVGTLEGLGEGVIWGLDRAGRGAWDILTFWAPNYNGAPPTHELEIGGSTTTA